MEKLFCCDCDAELKGEELESPYEDNVGNIICDGCYEDNYNQVCEICQNWFRKPITPEKTYFVLAEEDDL